MTLAAGALFWTGSTLLLSALRPFRSPGLVGRLRPYLVAEPSNPGGGRVSLGGLSLVLGNRLSRLGRSVDPIEARLRRAGHRLDPTAFRFRQVSHAVLGLGATGALLAAAPVALGPGAVLALVLGTPVAVFAAHEQLLAAQDRGQTRQVVRELPIVAEQLAMLLASGRSVATAIADLGERGRGPCSADLLWITRRLRQGVDEATALRDWADLRRTAGITHLVGVLTLAREATDLDHLVEQEAEAIRADAHRGLLAELERRSQQVWVPVTVATLLPGSLLLLVPFLDALRLFAGA